MSDDSSNDSRPQTFSAFRNPRQRFKGADGDYIYRKALRVNGADGTKRRVNRGDPVDVEGDGITLRRLKALWYAEAIELANFDGARERLTKNIVNNRALREAEQRLRAEEDAMLAEQRSERRKLNALRREEAEQRRLAEQAVKAAEEKERREIEDMIADEERAKQEAAIEKRLADRRAKDAEKAATEAEKAAEEAQVAREREQVAKDRQEQAAKEAGEERVRLEQESAERAAERDAEQAKKVVTYEQREAAKPVGNPNSTQVDAKEQRDKILGSTSEG